MNTIQIPDSEIESQFRDFMKLHNCEAFGALSLVMDGQIHRYRTADDKKASQKSGAYCLYSDGWPAGWIQNWRNGEAISWRFERGKIKDGRLKNSLTQEQINAMNERSKIHQAELKARQEELRVGAAMRAQVEFEKLDLASNNHPYLQRKRVKSYGLRVSKDNRLAVALMDIDDKFMSIQWISPDGEKRFFPNAPTSGAFYSFGLEKLQKKKDSFLFLGEGYCTMATAFYLAQENVPCVAAMNCGNLMTVAKALKDKYPEARIVILADNDHHNKDNPGITAAQKVVKSLNLPVCVSPEFQDNEDGTDWNDYYLLHGVEKARERLRALVSDVTMTPEEKADKAAIQKINTAIKKLDPNIILPPQEFIGGLFPRKFITLLAAPSGTGKTIFIQRISSDLSIGGSIFDGFTENEPVRKCIIFAGEAGYELMLRRGAVMKWAVNPDNVLVIDQHDFELQNIDVMLDSAEGFINVKRIMKEHKPDLLVFDTFSSFHERDENKATEMKPIIKQLANIARDFNCAVVLVHHSRKRTAKERSLSLNQDDVIGSSILNRLVGLIIGIEPMTRDDESMLLVRPLKTWFKAFMPFTYKITQDLDGRAIMQTDLTPANVNNSKIAVWNYLNEVFAPGEWFSFTQIILSEIAINVTEWQLRRILAEFVKSGKLNRRGATKSLEYSIPGNYDYTDGE